MKTTDWAILIDAIMNAKPPKGKNAYTYAMIKDKTGIGISTVSRLATGDYTRLDYDSGVRLKAMHDELKASGNLKK